MLKIIACDDDVAFQDNLHRMINRWSAETGTAVDVALVTRGEDLLARHAASRADIIMLDMIMPLVNGMDAAHELRQSDTAVRLVFLTSSPEFALESYEVRAFDYLLKPVTYERVAQLLDARDSACGPRLWHQEHKACRRAHERQLPVPHYRRPV